MNYIEAEKYLRFVPMNLSKVLFYMMLELNFKIPYQIWKITKWHIIAIALMGNYFHKYEKDVKKNFLFLWVSNLETTIVKVETTYGPPSLTLDGEEITLQSKLAQAIEKGSLKADAKILWAKLTVRTTDNIDNDFNKAWFEKHEFLDYIVTEEAFQMESYFHPKQPERYVTIAGKRIKLGPSSVWLWDFTHELKTRLAKRETTLGQLWEMLEIEASNSGGTLLDNVTSMRLVKDKEVLIWGCCGDCQPQLSFCTDDSVYQDFVDYFGKDYSVEVGVCFKVSEPETRTIKYSEPVVEATGKMTERECCLR